MHATLTNETANPGAVVTDIKSALPSAKPSRREELIRVAREEFSLHGFAGASVVSIAARAGIRKSSLFHHFATKEELYDTSVRQLVRDVAAAVDAATASSGGFARRLELAVGAVQETLVAHPPAARLLVRALVDGDPSANSAIGTTGPALLDELVSALAAIVKAGIDEGAVPAQDTRHAALMLLGVVCFPFARPDLDPRALSQAKFGQTLAAQVAQGLLMVPR